jgi:HEAT repeat protein
MSEEKIKSLIASLEAKDWTKRREAIKGLVEIGQPAAEPLAAALREGSAELRYMAALILGKLRSAAAIPSLVKSIADEDERVRANAALALGELGGEEAFKALVAGLKDEDWWVRSCVADALGWSGDARAVGPLIAALKVEERLAQEAAASLADEDEESFLAGQVVGEMGDATRVSVVGEIDPKEYTVRRTIIRALNRIGTPEALAAAQEYGEQ